jgi:hypothetical protein
MKTNQIISPFTNLPYPEDIALYPTTFEAELHTFDAQIKAIKAKHSEDLIQVRQEIQDAIKTHEQEAVKMSLLGAVAVVWVIVVLHLVMDLVMKIWL